MSLHKRRIRKKFTNGERSHAYLDHQGASLPSPDQTKKLKSVNHWHVSWLPWKNPTRAHQKQHLGQVDMSNSTFDGTSTVLAGTPMCGTRRPPTRGRENGFNLSLLSLLAWLIAGCWHVFVSPCWCPLSPLAFIHWQLFAFLLHPLLEQSSSSTVSLSISISIYKDKVW
jgi:hypothetical protein